MLTRSASLKSLSNCFWSTTEPLRALATLQSFALGFGSRIELIFWALITILAPGWSDYSSVLVQYWIGSAHPLCRKYENITGLDKCKYTDSRGSGEFLKILSKFRWIREYPDSADRGTMLNFR